MTDLLARVQAALSARYAIERELGRGGWATVYLATDLKLARPVAVKVLHPEVSAALGSDRFLREIAVTAQLAHPHILPLHDSGEAGGLLYYVMPHVEGETLRQRLLRDRQLPLEDALRITAEVADALTYAHAHGVVHRDVKPDNIFLVGGEAIVADFGIALALSAAGGEKLTQTGLALGTPAYMSPEQAAGDPGVDRRSDIYSLGCVLYEMLAGEPPFSSPTPRAVLARQMLDTPPPLAILRSSVPPAVEQAVGRALAKAPADRYDAPMEFAAALRAAQPQARAYPRRRARRWWAAAAAGAAVLAGAAAWYGLLRGPGLDPELHVVLPFAYRGGAVAPAVTGDQIESLLYEGLQQWRDVRLVTGLRTHDALQRRGGAALTLRDALAVARDVGAGRLVWGDEWIVGDSAVVHASLYDVASGSQLSQQDARLALPVSSLGLLDSTFNHLTAQLLEPPIGGVTRVRESVGTSSTLTGARNFGAWKDLTNGQAAFEHWQPERAESLFRAAADSDPEYAKAYLSLAQLGNWAGRAVAEWQGYAFKAVSFLRRMTNWRDSTLALGMRALAEGAFQDACNQFRAALQRDSLDVEAWYGLGECLRRDTVVLAGRDRAAPWHFRSSYEGAVRAYQRALQLAPSFQMALGPLSYERLAHLLVAERWQVRFGRAAPPDTGLFMAYPALDHDTLVFSPYGPRAFLTQPPPRSMWDAVERGRNMQRDLVRRWVIAFPQSAAAHAAWGEALELDGVLGEESGGRESALAETRAALRMEGDPAARLRMRLAEIRLRLKLQEFAVARRLADSLVAANPDPDSASAWYVACAAGLVGRARTVDRMIARTVSDTSFRMTSGRPPERVLVANALRLWAYAGFAAPAESLTAIRAGMGVLLRRYLSTAARREAVRHDLMDVSMLYAFPALGMREEDRPSPGYPLSDAQWALAHGDTAGARARLRDMRAGQTLFTPGDVLPILAYHQAYLLAAVGDTSAAEGFLDLLLENLPAAPTNLLVEPPMAASLVRAMALRARLAARRGDLLRARRWASAVGALWSGADPELKAVADSLRVL